jgi:hypothetical protein
MSRVLFAVLAALALLLVARAARAEPVKTTVGVYINQVERVDLKNNSFTVDFWLWFRAAPRDPQPIDTFELLDGRINAKTNMVKKTLPDGLQYGAARINATINTQWDLRRYPFDDHDLVIRIEDSDLDVARSVFLADAQSQGKDPGVAVSGWDITRFDHQVVEHRYPSNYGDTSISQGAESRFSSYVVTLRAERRGIARYLKICFPLLVAVLIAWCAFFIRPKDASPRVAVSVGALFAAAAGTLAIHTQLPDINYATASDRTVFLCLGMILLSLLSTVIVLSLPYAGKEAQHRRVDKLGGAVFPLIFALLLLTVVR